MDKKNVIGKSILEVEVEVKKTWRYPSYGESIIIRWYTFHEKLSNSFESSISDGADKVEYL